MNKDYNKWYKNQDFNEVTDTDELIYDINNYLNKVRNMTVEEYTLYRKWEEIQTKWHHYENPLPFVSGHNIPTEIKQVKNMIWRPDKHNDYLNLEPCLVNIQDNNFCKISNNKIWKILREFTSSMINNSGITRNLYYIVIDNVTKKLLGVIQVGSDYLDLGPRDKWIGWTRYEKNTNGKTRNTAIGSTIVPTQPLGYYYLGGKLLSLLTCSKKIENDWKDRYGDVLVNLTTTSLYGSFSQYNSLKHWKKLGKSNGTILYEPSKKIERKMMNWLWYNYPYEYWCFYVATREDGKPLRRLHKQRSFNFIYNKLDINKELTYTNHKRGVYHCPLYTNAREFLRNEISEDGLTRRFDNDIVNLTELWKSKYASKRIKKFKEVDINKFDILFYDDLMFVDWEEAKNKFAKDVGR